MSNIVLTGFMGTGKSTIGLLIAHTLGWQFVDADAAIEEKVGLSIPEIFARVGEDGFRRYEAAVCQSLAARQYHVIATGGGMLLDPANRALMTASGIVICLNATPEAIEERLGNFEGRPLAPNWRQLLKQRMPTYAKIPHQIDTTGRAPQDVAEEVIRLWRRSST